MGLKELKACFIFELICVAIAIFCLVFSLTAKAKEQDLPMSIEEINSATVPKGAIYETRNADMRLVEEGTLNYGIFKGKLFYPVTGRSKLYSSSAPMASTQDGMIYTEYFVKDENGRSFNILLINDPGNGDYVAANVTDEAGNSTLFTFYDENDKTYYDKIVSTIDVK